MLPEKSLAVEASKRYPSAVLEEPSAAAAGRGSQLTVALVVKASKTCAPDTRLAKVEVDAGTTSA